LSGYLEKVLYETTPKWHGFLMIKLAAFQASGNACMLETSVTQHIESDLNTERCDIAYDNRPTLSRGFDRVLSASLDLPSPSQGEFVFTKA
jgi:hypothetical protein